VARYFLNIGTDFGDTANWSDTDGGAGGFSVPTSADDTYFTANSGNCTVNTSLRQCRILDFTGYTNTITIDNPLRANNDLTLSSTMTFAGTSYLQVFAASTITSNTKVCPLLRVGGVGAGNITITLADDWNVTELQAESHSITLNGNNIFISTNYTGISSGSTTGTTVLEFTGTGTISNGSVIRNDVNINSTGTITLGAALNYQAGVFTDLGLGTVVTTGNTLTTAGGTYDTPNITWNNVFTSNTGAGNITLSDVFNISGTLSRTDAFPTTFNGSTINLSGSLTITSGIFNGTSNLLINGTGTWSGTGDLRLNTTINTAGTLTISGTVSFQGATLTYTAGTVVTTSSRLNVNSTATLNIGGINLNEFSTVVASSYTITLLDNLNILGDYFMSANNATIITWVGGYTINCYSDVFHSGGSQQGDVIFYLRGTGSFVQSGASTITGANVDFIVEGDYIFRGNSIAEGTCTFLIGNFTILPGNYVATSFNFIFGGSVNINISEPNSFTMLVCSFGGNATLLNDIYCIRLSSGNTSTINGYKIYTYKGIFITNNIVLNGTTEIEIFGNDDSTIVHFASSSFIRNNIIFNSEGRFTCVLGRLDNSTLTYLKGNVYFETLQLDGTMTLLNFDKVLIKNVVRSTSAGTITMNKFFSSNYLPITTTVSRTALAAQFDIVVTEPSYSHNTKVRNVNITPQNYVILTHPEAYLQPTSAAPLPNRGFILGNQLGNDIPENNHQDVKHKMFNDMNAFPVLNY